MALKVEKLTRSLKDITCHYEIFCLDKQGYGGASLRIFSLCDKIYNVNSIHIVPCLKNTNSVV